MIAATTAALAYYEALRGHHAIEFGVAELVGLSTCLERRRGRSPGGLGRGAAVVGGGARPAREVLRRAYTPVRQGRMLMVPPMS